MIKTFFHKNFLIWFKTNRHRFKYTPYIVNKSKRSFTLKFQGISHLLRAKISSNGNLEVFCHHPRFFKGKIPCDIIMEFDLFETKDSSGHYFCEWCDHEGTATRFKKRKELWEKHTLEPFINWTNENFQNDSWLIFNGMKSIDHYSQARLLSEENAKELFKRNNFKKELFDAVPLIKNRNIDWRDVFGDIPGDKK